MNRKTFFKSLLGLCGLAAVGLPATVEPPKKDDFFGYERDRGIPTPKLLSIFDVRRPCGCLAVRRWLYESSWPENAIWMTDIVRAESSIVGGTFRQMLPGTESNLIQESLKLKHCHYPHVRDPFIDGQWRRGLRTKTGFKDFKIGLPDCLTL